MFENREHGLVDRRQRAVWRFLSRNLLLTLAWRQDFLRIIGIKVHGLCKISSWFIRFHFLLVTEDYNRRSSRL